MTKKSQKVMNDTEVDVTAVEEEILQEVTAPTRVLRSLSESYEGRKKSRCEALLTICYAKTSIRAMLSVKQLKNEIDYNGKTEWLDIRYDDEGKAVLIGKSSGDYGIKPICKDKKYIIYSSSIVKEFVNALGLEFTEHSSRSVYLFKKEKIEGKDFIVVEGKDFI